MLGAAFIWFPASVILLIQGSYISAVILFLWGSLVISLVDNVIWSWLVSGKAMLHPLAIFFSFLGGIIVFGPIGLFVGPFVFALLLILIDIVKEINEPERISTGT
jgi:predicted PurR-regulated permease PerM